MRRVVVHHHRGGEAAPLAQLALHLDEAIHGQHEAAHDVQAEARAAEAARRRGVGLRERLEDAFQAVGRDADAAVLHGAVRQEALLAALEMQLGMDVALRGELDGVADEVGQHPPELHRVAEHRVRAVGAGQGRELDAFAPGLVLELGDDLLERAHRVEGDELDRDVAAVQPGEVEDVAHHVLELRRAPLDLGEGLGGFDPGSLQRGLAEALDGVDRVPDLVGDVRHELPLGRGHFLGLLEGDPQPVMFVHGFRDVGRERQEAGGQAGPALHAFVRHADQAGASVQRLEAQDAVPDALARADDFLVELQELLGRRRGEDIPQAEVVDEPSVRQPEELVEAAARVEDAALQVAEDDEVGRVLDERAREAHAGARREQRQPVDQGVVREEQPDLVVLLRVRLHDDLDRPDRRILFGVPEFEQPAPGRPPGGIVEQRGNRSAVIQFEEEQVDVHAGPDPPAQGSVGRGVGMEHQAGPVAHHVGPGQEVGE